MLAIKIPEYQYHSGHIARHVAHCFDAPMQGNQTTIFGQTKNGPVLPVLALAGAAGSISAGAGVLAAAGTLFSAGGLIGGLMIAGGVASGLGFLTGNKTLSTIGMGLSLAGGVGSAFIDSSGSFLLGSGKEYAFSDSIMGEKLKGVTDFFSDLGGSDTPGAVVNDAGDILSGAKEGLTVDAGSELGLTESSRALGENTGLISTSDASGPGIRLSSTDTLNNEVTNAAANATSSPGINLSGGSGVPTPALGAQPEKKGLLDSFGLQTKDVLALASGLSDGYASYNETEANAPLRQAQLAQTNLQTELLKERQAEEERQRQNLNDPSVYRSRVTLNSNAAQAVQPGQVRPVNANGANGQFAFVDNGVVRYVTAEELQALQAARAQQQQQQQQPATSAPGTILPMARPGLAYT